MIPRIETLPEKKLVGQRLRMSFAHDRTGELWRSFMPRRKEIINPATADLLSLQVYDKPLAYAKFSPTTEFEKWALVEVTGFDSMPEGLETFTLPAGLYAVFLYKGASSEFTETFQFIFGTWLPSSEYVLDDRPHFEVLGEKYRNNDPDSEEEIWVPIRLKSK
ncbi:GyrI-like domain-containing protein [Larkinella insperata]|uniref:GyrI-like domain-containing protein n=1 Tax=Larkinella insperata TaxID=332158 RepID=A0ABW3QGF9_9BACT|nr:GyrI-like domain-containing protein [Larkinella insperata]